MVPLASIDASDSGVTGPESFGKGYSPDDLAWAFDALHEVVLPAVGHGLGAEYFQSRDQAEGLVGTRSYSDTYSGFFGDSAIKLESRGDGTYGVANGYHRVWVAQRLGLDSVPGGCADGVVVQRALGLRSRVLAPHVRGARDRPGLERRGAAHGEAARPGPSEPGGHPLRDRLGAT